MEENQNNTPSQYTGKTTSIRGMFQDWFLDYASYVILERAVPHINDGLKPVQRRILHSMKELDDGRYNKVANIVGNTMKYHPHGDASIAGALVTMGQKDLLIDCQGNWGNILTGDSAAAPRYIEARLSKFALEVVFNPKTTTWHPSYDGRNEEPDTLPVKFPLLLAQGAEGIAVGLACKILPHNFNELIDASIAILHGEDFSIYPDFPTAGLIDVSKYNDGLQGGRVRVRARIKQLDARTIVITEIPFTTTADSLIDSIVKACEKNQLKIKKIDNNTAQDVEIRLSLPADTSPDQTIDALYAFTDCEISLSPNSCVIENEKPRFASVSDILRASTQNTVNLLKRELEIKLGELNEKGFWISLERIFIKEGVYKLMEKCTSDEQIDKAWFSMILDLPKDVIQLLGVLKLKYKLFLFSNTNELHIEFLKKDFERQLGFDLFNCVFNKAYFSNEIHLRKPNKEAFEYILHDAGISAEETLFIDDSPQHLEGAKKVGLNTYWLTNGETLIDLYDKKII